jgi:hypothetical protein
LALSKNKGQLEARRLREELEAELSKGFWRGLSRAEEARLEYPHLEKRRNMLRLLSNALDEARKVHGDHQLRLYFKRGSMLTGEAQLLVYRTEQDVAGDLNLSGAEAVGLLNELDGDGYLHLDYGKHGPNASWGFVNVRLLERWAFNNSGLCGCEVHGFGLGRQGADLGLPAVHCDRNNGLDSGLALEDPGNGARDASWFSEHYQREPP